MSEVPVEVSLSGDASAMKLEALIGDGEAELPDSRRSMRKRLLSRGRLLKSSLKSPLMRMAEMRKGGLRGREVRHLGRNGLDESEVKAGKGKKRLEGRGSRALTVIPVNCEVGDGSLGGLGLEGSNGGGFAEGLQGDDCGMVSSGVGELVPGDGSGEGVPEVAGVEEVVDGSAGNSGGLVAEMAEDCYPSGDWFSE